MEATKYYSEPGMARSYFDWCYKGKAGCPPAASITKILKENNISNFSGGTLVDLGAGPGTSMPVPMIEFNFKKCILVDASDEMLKFSYDVFGSDSEKIVTLKSDLQKDKLNIPNKTSDLVISCSTFPYLNSISNCINETSRIIKNGGFFGFNGFFHLEDTLDSRESLNEFGVKFYFHSLLKLQQLIKNAGFKEIASVKIEKTDDQLKVEDILKGFGFTDEDFKPIKEEIYNRLFVLKKL